MRGIVEARKFVVFILRRGIRLAGEMGLPVSLKAEAIGFPSLGSHRL